MIKALMKKQMSEIFSGYGKKRDGTRRDKRGVIVMSVLLVFFFAYLCVSFYFLFGSMCKPLAQVGLGWLYIAIGALVAMIFGVFGSVFSTYSSLYRAKDNDLLLSMPIKPRIILFARLFGVYIWGLIYELAVMIPIVIAWFIHGNPDAFGVVFTLLVTVVLSFFILVLSCVLGFVVAAISGRMKSKNFAAVILSIALLAAYWFLYTKMLNVITDILAYADRLASAFKKALYPFYHMGRAAEGSVVSLLIFTAIVAVLFLTVYIVLSKSFIKLATVNKGERKKAYREKKAKGANVNTALLRKEFKRFTGSATYMLNCGLGLLFLIVAAVAIVIKANDLRMLFDALFGKRPELVALVLTVIICFMVPTLDITAPSISLEGKNLWILKVIPVNGWQVLRAKLSMHMIIVSVPTVIVFVCAIAVFRLSVISSMLMIVTVLAFELVMAEFGLFINLKKHSFDWTNEIIPIKQSMSVALTLFGGMALAGGAVGLFFAVHKFMSPLVYFICICVLFVALAILLFVWLRKKGATEMEKI
ncbi:MAG: hypothetical protein E7607_05035 [Ruminococcaceae bacterium]|nr:hypothetical protein [Oscillospiraceae bacterium]